MPRSSIWHTSFSSAHLLIFPWNWVPSYNSPKHLNVLQIAMLYREQTERCSYGYQCKNQWLCNWWLIHVFFAYRMVLITPFIFHDLCIWQWFSDWTLTASLDVYMMYLFGWNKNEGLSGFWWPSVLAVQAWHSPMLFRLCLCFTTNMYSLNSC